VCIPVFPAHTQHQVAEPLEAPPPGVVYAFQLIDNLAVLVFILYFPFTIIVIKVPGVTTTY